MDNQLKRSAPEAQGISSAALLGFVNALDQQVHEMHGFMLLRHGQVIAEGWWSPYRPELPHMLFSLSKSFTSTAVGLAVAEGRLSLDDTVLSFFPKDAPVQVSENLAAMRVRHLISMTTGHHDDTTGPMQQRYRKNWIKGFLALPVEHAPGTHWLYNTGATYLLAAIVQKVTGMKLIDYLQPRLFDPLGIQGAWWETSPQGVNMGGWGLNVKTEDIARLGQLYLDKGVWNGKRILSQAWVEEASASFGPNDRTDEDWHQGYGYQFWRCRHNAYRGDGAFGQYCVVLPDQDAVMAITSGVDDMQLTLDVAWEHLLPAFKAKPLPANAAAHEELQNRLAHLLLPPPAGRPSSPMVAIISGKVFHFEPNPNKFESASFDFKADGCHFKINDATGEHQSVVPQGAWKEGGGLLFNGMPARTDASGAWRSDVTYVMELRFVETPFYNTFVCYFSDGKVNIDSRINVSFGPKGGPQLVGHAA